MMNSIAQSQETFAQHIAKNEDFAQLVTLRLNQINPCMPAVLPSNFDPNKFKKRDGY
jgi:hypothetical protein